MLTKFASAVVVALAVSGCAPATENAEGRLSAPLETRTASADLATGAVDLDSMLAEDIEVVRATAGASTHSANKTDPTVPETHQEFTTLEAVRGEAPDKFTVELTGGEAADDHGKYVLELEGQPQFKEGSEYLLVLFGPLENGEYWTFGGAQGRYDVVDGVVRATEGSADSDPIIAKLDGLKLEEAEKLLGG